MTGAAAIEQRAALWLVRRENIDWSPADQAEFEAWLEQSMAHKAAYWRLEHGWREADRIGSLGLAQNEAVTSRRNGMSFWRPLAIAASFVVALMAGIDQVLIWPSSAVTPQHFETTVGVRKIVPLVDGSRVELNTASAVRTAVNDKVREVWLDKGEAYFEIAHRDGLPFVVHAGSRTVTVLGTKFSVRRDGDKVTVSVVEGRVRVDDAIQPDSVPAAIITAGDVAVARGSSTLLAGKSEDRVVSSLGWRNGILNFSDTTLVDAAAEFNRYNAKKIRIGDDETGAIRIGGTFQVSNVDGFVRLLHEAYGLKIEDSDKGVTISS